jgi:hypothetical protein
VADESVVAATSSAQLLPSSPYGPPIVRPTLLSGAWRTESPNRYGFSLLVKKQPSYGFGGEPFGLQPQLQVSKNPWSDNHDNLQHGIIRYR